MVSLSVQDRKRMALLLKWCLHRGLPCLKWVSYLNIWEWCKLNTQAGLRGSNHPDSTGDNKKIFPTLPRLCKLEVMESPPPHGLFVCWKTTFSIWQGMLPDLPLPFPFAILPEDIPKQYKKRSQHHSDKLSPATMPIKITFLTPHFPEPDICPKSQVIHPTLPLTWVILQTSFCYS